MSYGGSNDRGDSYGRGDAYGADNPSSGLSGQGYNEGTRTGLRSQGLGDSDTPGFSERTTEYGGGDNDRSGYGTRTAGLGGDSSYGRGDEGFGSERSGLGTRAAGLGGDHSRGADDGFGSARSGRAGGLGDDDGFGAGAQGRTGGGLGTDDTYGDSARTGGAQYGSSDLPKRTGGGLGADDTAYGTSAATGGAQYGSQQTPGRTGGGLGEDDTAYNTSAASGGAGTNFDDNYGVGSGRNRAQEHGGVGGEFTQSEHDRYDDRDNKKSSKDDSTTGKIMEKVGGVFKSDKLQQQGAEKRAEARDNY